MKNRLGPLPELLAEKNVSPGVLAQSAGLEIATITRWLEGKAKRITNEKLQVIAEALEVDLGDLCAMTALQQDFQSVLQIRADLEQLEASLGDWRAPKSSEARRWAPTRELVDSIIAGLTDLLERDFDLPPEKPVAPKSAPPKLRRPSRTEPADAS